LTAIARVTEIAGSAPDCEHRGPQRCLYLVVH
jgi:hypothetical protein